MPQEPTPLCGGKASPGLSAPSEGVQLPSHRFSVAPMHGWTTPSCRFFYRQLTKRALLYTEMVVAQAFLRGGVEARVLSEEEKPLALQLADHDPITLSKATERAEALGYTEINLNLGCPSPRLQAMKAGAYLFAHPKEVGACLYAMQSATQRPVTLKLRVGVDQHHSLDTLFRFIEITHRMSGIRCYQIHARKAWLQGVSPAKNRTLPRLQHDWVYACKAAFPELDFVLNGGLTTLEEALQALQGVDGVMLGRAVWQDPLMLTQVDPLFFNTASPYQGIVPFLQKAEEYLAHAGSPLHSKQWLPLLSLFYGRPFAKKWRKALSEEIAACKKAEKKISLVALYRNCALREGK